MLDFRSQELEIIDLDSQAYTREEYDDCLEQLDKIGVWLGGDRATLKAISRHEEPIDSILDVGCGGGLFTLKLARHFPNASILGIDINSAAIEFAKNKLGQFNGISSHLQFETRQMKGLDEPNKSFDVVTSTLVCHHMQDSELIDFITKASCIAKKKVVLNDLHRHPLALVLFKIISPLCFNNRLVLHDGPISIRRGFKYHDWVNYLEKAGIKKSQYRIQWHWAFRWLIEIYTS